MALPKKRWQKVLLGFLMSLLVLSGLLLVFTCSLIGVADETLAAYQSLKDELRRQGHHPRFLVISGRRYALDNKLLATFGGASRNSRHLRGDAIDVIVLDVNGDGRSDRRDVDIVYRILDRTVIGDAGGVGTYKNEKGFFNRQMVHFDCRGHRAGWHR